MKPTIIIAGLGSTGVELARRLCDGWEVIAIDSDARVLQLAALKESCSAQHVGDATSAHVLQSIGADRAQVVVASTDDDAKNLEILRVARERFGIQRRLAMMRDHGWTDRYQAEGVELVDRFRACAAVLASRILGGHRVATDVGLGRGEIMEVEVLASSSVIGQRLAELRPRRWLVGAVYRRGELIVPHGDTVIEAGDRMLVIGDPEILPAIATLIGAGESEFPLQYGARLVAVGVDGLSGLIDEARYLLSCTAARGFAVVVSADEAPIARRLCEAAGVAVELIEVEAAGPAARAAIADDDVGVFLLPADPLSLARRVGLGRSRTVAVLDAISSPALVCRNSLPYGRVLLLLAELPFSMHAARLAIDLVRMIDAELHLGVIHQPELVVGRALRREMEDRQRQVVELAQIYRRSMSVVVMEGNPIYQGIERSVDYDLIVLPYRRGRRSSLIRPDVAQNLLHRVRCSVLVMPW